jgi:hypothetical protein
MAARLNMIGVALTTAPAFADNAPAGGGAGGLMPRSDAACPQRDFDNLLLHRIATDVEGAAPNGGGATPAAAGRGNEG